MISVCKLEDPVSLSFHAHMVVLLLVSVQCVGEAGGAAEQAKRLQLGAPLQGLLSRPLPPVHRLTAKLELSGCQPGRSGRDIRLCFPCQSLLACPFMLQSSA